MYEADPSSPSRMCCIQNEYRVLGYSVYGDRYNNNMLSRNGYSNRTPNNENKRTVSV